MARNKGLIPFSGNFEPQAAGPFDSRGVVSTKADLTDADTWKALDGNSYAYAGMTVTVTSDTPANNGLYWLAALPVTEESNWQRVGSVIQRYEVNLSSQLDGVKNAFDLGTSNYGTDFDLYYNNAHLEYNYNYELSGSTLTLTLTAPPAVGERLLFVYRA